MKPLSRTLPGWAEWVVAEGRHPYTVGLEEEVMLLEEDGWNLAHRIDAVLEALPGSRQTRFTAETHGSALEIQTAVHDGVGEAIGELAEARRELAEALGPLSLHAAGSGTHPFAVWQDIAVSAGERYQFVYGSMRELARREPTFGLHVHVGVPEAETAIRAANRLRLQIPLLLALSVNSPFWQGRDTGLASARTPLFQAFPRVGIPRAFADYADYVEAVDVLIRCDAVPEPTFLWWDVRPQPRFGTVEVRVMDAQTSLWEDGALAALVQCIVSIEGEGEEPEQADVPPEVLAENRFLAARDGMKAELIEPQLARRVPATDLLDELITACAPHAERLGCSRELERAAELGRNTGAAQQLARARALGSLPHLVEELAGEFLEA